MKKLIIYVIPGLLMLNACTEGRQGLNADQAAVIENSLVSGAEDSRNEGDTTAKAPQLDGSDLPEAPSAQPAPPYDGSHTLAPGAYPGHEAVDVTPAFPGHNDNQGGNGNGHLDGVQAVGPGYNFQQNNSSNPYQGIQDGNVNLAADAADQGQGNSSANGVQAVGSRPEVSKANIDVKVFDPLCNCYKASANNNSGLGAVQDADHPQFGQSYGTAPSSKKDDDDSDD